MIAFERRIAAAVIEMAVAPRPPLPPVTDTDAVTALERYVAASPAVNRVGLRLLLVAVELRPLAFGTRRRLTRSDRAARAELLRRLEVGRIAIAWAALRSLAQLSYYGDSGVMAALGYDAAANVERGRALRTAEGRW